ncbi:MAG: FMN-binding protein [Bacteroidia bacterium]|nr:FMN-binding protein [Bacteroidia bacterium]
MSTTELHIGTQTSSFNMLKAMVSIGFMCALMIVLTYEGTFNRIEKNKAEALEKAIFKVLPGITKKDMHFVDASGISLESKGEESGEKIIYAGFDDNDKLVGYAIEASGIGFADIIRILYGYDPHKQEVIGFYVLESKETPGLGDKIEKDDVFLANFKDLDVSLKSDLSGPNNKVVTVKSGAKKNKWELDGITGATISSRAIGDIIGASTEMWLPVIYPNYHNIKGSKTETNKEDNE